MQALVARSEDLAKGWLLAMVEAAPLEEAPAILAGELAREGPLLCAGVVRALGRDEDLRELQVDGELFDLVSRTGELTGGVGVSAGLRAAETLAGVIWSGLRSELRDPDPEVVSELAERLALVMSFVREAVLGVAAASVRTEPVRTEPVPGPAPDADPVLVPQPQPEPIPDPLPGPPPAPPALRLHPVPDEERSAETPSTRNEAHVRPGETSLTEGVEEALWKGALRDEVRRAEGSGLSLSLLLVELQDADRLVAVEAASEASATFGRFAQALRGVLRRHDILACETEGRAWVIARDTGRLGAHSLSRRAEAAVAAAAPWRGAPLSVSVGYSVLREDAGAAEDLIAAAEDACLEAAASGSGVYPDLEPIHGSG